MHHNEYQVHHNDDFCYDALDIRYDAHDFRRFLASVSDDIKTFDIFMLAPYLDFVCFKEMNDGLHKNNTAGRNDAQTPSLLVKVILSAKTLSCILSGSAKLNGTAFVLYAEIRHSQVITICNQSNVSLHSLIDGGFVSTGCEHDA